MRFRFAKVIISSALFFAATTSSPLGVSADDDPLRPAAIETENVPVADPDLVARLAPYLNTRSAGFAGWSPEGDSMLVRTRFGNATQLHEVHAPGGRREQVTFFDEPVGGRYVPGRTDDSLLVSMSRGGDENYQVYRFDREAGRPILLTDGTSRNRLGPVRDDGTQAIIHNNSRNGRDTDMYLAAIDSPGSLDPLLETDGEFWYSTDWSRDGKQLLMAQYVSINEVYPGVFDLEDRRLRRLPIPGGVKAAYGDLAFTNDGKSAYVTTDARGEFLELAEVDLQTGEYRWLADDLKWNVNELEVDHKSGRLAFTVNVDGADELYILDGDDRRRLEVPLGIISGLEFSPDGERIGFTLARPDAPADAYSIRLKDGELTRWTFSEVGGLNPDRFVSPTRFRFKTFDGKEIPAYYFRPRTATANDSVPVLVMIHGGPESQYRPYLSALTQFFVNELGIAVVAPNVRGSAGYGKSYLKLDNAQLREDSVRDIGALLDWIAEQPELNASRVAVYGGSYGGYMVLASLVHFGDRLRAGIDVVGIASFISFLERTSPYRQDLRRAEYGDERDADLRAFFERIDPLANAEKIRSALLVAHGRNDPRVPFSEAQQIAEKVRGQGREVWTLYADNEGHGFGKKDNRDYLTAIEAMFLKQHLVD